MSAFESRRPFESPRRKPFGIRRRGGLAAKLNTSLTNSVRITSANSNELYVSPLSIVRTRHKRRKKSRNYLWRGRLYRVKKFDRWAAPAKMCEKAEVYFVRKNKTRPKWRKFQDSGRRMRAGALGAGDRRRSILLVAESSSYLAAILRYSRVVRLRVLHSGAHPRRYDASFHRFFPRPAPLSPATLAHLICDAGKKPGILEDAEPWGLGVGKKIRARIFITVAKELSAVARPPLRPAETIPGTKLLASLRASSEKPSGDDLIPSAVCPRRDSCGE